MNENIFTLPADKRSSVYFNDKLISCIPVNRYKIDVDGSVMRMFVSIYIDGYEDETINCIWMNTSDHNLIEFNGKRTRSNYGSNP